MKLFRYSLLLFSLLLGYAHASCAAASKAEELMSPLSRRLIFEWVWKTVADNYLYEDFQGLDWKANKQLYSDKISHAATNADFYLSLDEMIYSLSDDHSVYLAPWESCLEDQSSDILAYHDALSIQRLEQAPEIVLVSLHNFDSRQLDEAFSRAMRKILNEGSITTLIFDLRNNYGGYLQIAFNILAHFVSGKLGTETDRKGSYPLSTAAGKHYQALKNTRLIVLINQESHSAAELFAGILQLERGATIMGSTSAGNTEIILPFDFFDGSRLWLAVSGFRLRNGLNLEGRGVIPDIVIEDDKHFFDKVLEHSMLANKLVDKDN